MDRSTERDTDCERDFFQHGHGLLPPYFL
jgi:hypothetical protein